MSTTTVEVTEWEQDGMIHTIIDYSQEHDGHDLTPGGDIRPSKYDRYKSAEVAFCRTCDKTVVLNTYEVTNA